MLKELKEIVNPDVVIDICVGSKTLIVKENGASSKIKKLVINGIPDKAFAFTLDHQPKGRAAISYKQLSCYVDAACDSGANKGCDLVVVTDLGDHKYRVLVFDLKSDKPRKVATEKQLLNSELYVKYLMAMLENHSGVDVSSIEYRRAIVTTDKKAIRKGPVHRPIARQLSGTSYRVKSVTVNAAKESSVHFGAL